MHTNLNEKNQITLMGTMVETCKFSHEIFGEKFYEILVEVPRLSEEVDRLSITVSERLVDIDNLKIGDVIEVNGQLRSYNNQKHDSDNKLKLTIFARDMNVLNEMKLDKNPNQIFLDGYICKPPVYRETPLGREICDIIVAVNRAYNKSDYIPVIAWGRNAKFSKTLQVGDNVKIWGRMQSRPYDKKLADGSVINKIAYEVSISKMELTEKNNRKN